MASKTSPLRSHSREKYYNGGSQNYRQTEVFVENVDKENFDGDSRRQNSKSPYAGQQTRQFQYKSRFGISGGQSTNAGTNAQFTNQRDTMRMTDQRDTMRMTDQRDTMRNEKSYERQQNSYTYNTQTVREERVERVVEREAPRAPRLSQHQEFFISDLTNDINDLKNRQRDFTALKEQYRYLEDQYKNIQIEKQKLENKSLDQIANDRIEIDRLIRELDQVRQENITVEQQQIQLLETIFNSDQEVNSRTHELTQHRSECSNHDSNNLSVRKEIEFQERLVNEQKEVGHNQYNSLLGLREVQVRCDNDVCSLVKRVDILNVEINNNDQRCESIQSLLQHKEESISKTSHSINQAHGTIQEEKYNLNKLDGELGYFESQNEQHKNGQAQLFKANEYEYIQSKEHQLRHQELLVVLQKAEADEQSVAYEVDRLKSHSEQMYSDQIELQAEVAALDKHMANLNNQNYCLQKELEGFIEADDQVRKGLDRKAQVEQIRSKVDDVIRRSQFEVQSRVQNARDLSNRKSAERTQIERTQTTQVQQNVQRVSQVSSTYQSKSQNRQNSPLRTSYDIQNRKAFRPEDNDMQNSRGGSYNNNGGERQEMRQEVRTEYRRDENRSRRGAEQEEQQQMQQQQEQFSDSQGFRQEMRTSSYMQNSANYDNRRTQGQYERQEQRNSSSPLRDDRNRSKSGGKKGVKFAS